MNMRRTAPCIGMLLAIFSIEQAIAGFSMTPLVTVLDPAAGVTSGEVILKSENGDAKIPMPVELKITGREVDLSGSQVIYPNDKSAEKFIVYPSQVVLMPGESQRVQIKWVGDNLPKKEIAFGLIAEQAPVKFGDEDKPRAKAEGRLIILGRYEGIILLHSKGFSPNVVVDSAGPQIDSSGKAKLILLLNNIGTARQVLTGISLTISPVGKDGKMMFEKKISYKPVIPESQIKQKLYAGYRRQLTMPWPEQLPVGPVKVSVKFEEEKK